MVREPDLRFQSVGKWYVLGKGPHTGHGQFWICQCACSSETTALHEAALVEERTLSCGCDSRDKLGRLQKNARNLVGQQFASWLVLRNGVPSPRGMKYWHCRCLCGSESEVEGYKLSLGRSTQCRQCADRQHPNVRIHRWYNNWFVLKRIEKKTKSRHTYYQCLCGLCGQIQDIQGTTIANGRSKSCGCTHLKARHDSAAQLQQARKEYLFLKQQLQHLHLPHDWLGCPDEDT
jgi:hypothetical protein